MRPRVYVDVDDVLCRTAQVAVETVRDLFGISRTFDQLHSFNLDEAFGLSPEQLDILLTHLNSAAGLRHIPPRSGATACLLTWSQVAEICVVTGRSPKNWRATRDWLKSEEVACDRLLFANKYDRFDAADLASGADIVSNEDLLSLDFAFAVEDSASYSRSLAGLGIPVLLMDRPWNRDREPGDQLADNAAAIIRCAGWPAVEREARALLPLLGAGETEAKGSVRCQ